MNTELAFARAKAAKGSKHKVFDWNKAAKIIKESSAKNASAGLSEDWEWTGGEIFRNGKPLDSTETYVYLASNWAIPELEIDDEYIECWCHNNDWDAGTFWPVSALEILGS